MADGKKEDTESDKLMCARWGESGWKWGYESNWGWGWRNEAGV